MANYNARGKIGNKGGGRKSAYQEKADAEALLKMFFEKMDKNELQKIVKSGKYSLKDVWLFKAFGGNEKILGEIFRKIFPDTIIHKGDEHEPIVFEDRNPKINSIIEEAESKIKNEIDEQIKELKEKEVGKNKS